MVKIVFKNGIEVTVDTTGKAILHNEDWRLDTDVDDDSVTITDNDGSILFCGKWSEVLYIQKI